ncbi:MAG: alpha-galactosidase [Kiritimatiellia bacterium]
MQTVLALMSVVLGSWQVTFNEDNAQLNLVNENAEVAIDGRLSFTAGEKEWKVVSARDAVPSRLALLDDRNDVQGYITFQENGDRLSMLVYHRTAQNYPGTLRFNGNIHFPADGFACRTQPLRSGRVLQLASGPADSSLNDSLFSAQKDRLLKIDALNRRISCREKGLFEIALSGKITEPSEAAWTFSVEKDYYRNRYVPYYSPINRKRCPSPPTGWMSWNSYFDKATAEDNLAEARIGKEQLQPFGMEFWSIESWQDNSDQLPVSKFSNLNLKPNPRQFPLGMKKLADNIRALGFRPGIWMAPFGTGNAEFYEAHKEWFLHDKNGKPLRTWNGVYTIDPTRQAVQDHLKKIFSTASHEWGYEYFKIDGMSGRNSGYCAHFYERPDIHAVFRNPECPNPFERCVKTFRKAIGEDRVFLACQGHATGPEAAFADAARTGADIVRPNHPPAWKNLENQARCTLNQVFANNIVFFTDPDTLMVGDYIGIEQARLATTVVALPGQMMFSGDKLAELTPERMRLLQQALPVCDVQPLDLYPRFGMLPVWDLKIRRSFGEWDVVALFNWSEKETSVGFDFAEIGLDPSATYVMDEFWTRTYQGIHKTRFEMPVPGHGVRLLAVHRAAAHPQYLSSDRHVTQGAVELTDLAWNDVARTLTGGVKTVKGFPLTLRFTTPPGFTFDSAKTENNASFRTDAGAKGVVNVKITSPGSQIVPFVLKWK